jgi:hypothetical protein
LSMIHAHIRAHHALADAFEEEADLLQVEAPCDNAVVCKTMRAVAAAYRIAATRLHRDEMATLERALSKD